MKAKYLSSKIIFGETVVQLHPTEADIIEFMLSFHGHLVPFTKLAEYMSRRRGWGYVDLEGSRHILSTNISRIRSRAGLNHKTDRALFEVVRDIGIRPLFLPGCPTCGCTGVH